jgi:4-cresol dehydrogenase (hydroxylating)
MGGTLRSAMHIGNDYKVLAATSQYPWAEMAGRTPLDRQTMRQMRRRATIGAWNGSGGLYGTRRQVREAKRLLRRGLAGRVDRLQFVDDRLISIMQQFAKPFRLLTGWDVSRTLSVLTPVYGLLRGEPTDAPLASAYWRKRVPPSAQMDPDRDRCGLLWCSPVVPNSGTHVTEVTDLAIDLLLRHGFEPQISVSLATERSAFCVTTISYDRDVAGEDARAMVAYRELSEALIARGYPPYRLNVAAMEYGADAAGYGDVLRAIKQAVDPNHVLAPGRYAAEAAAPMVSPEAHVVAV